MVSSMLILPARFIFLLLIADDPFQGSLSITCAAERPSRHVEAHVPRHGALHHLHHAEAHAPRHSALHTQKRHKDAETESVHKLKKRITYSALAKHKRSDLKHRRHAGHSVELGAHSHMLVPGGARRKARRSYKQSFISESTQSNVAAASSEKKQEAKPAPAPAKKGAPAPAPAKEGSKEASKEGEAEGEHEEEGLSDVVTEEEMHSGFVAGVLLIAFTCSLIGLLFLLNYPDPQVHSYAYKLLSHIISILCALMAEKSIDLVIMKGVIHPLSAPLDLSMELGELLSLIPFTCVFFLIRPMAYRYRNQQNWLFAIENIVAHLAAFISVEIFDEPLKWVCEHFEFKMIGHTLVYGSSPALGFLFIKASSKASNKFSESVLSIEEPPEPAEGQPQPELIRPNDDDDTEGGHHGVNNWVQAVSNAETEVSAILCGFLFKEFGEELIKFHAGQGANHDEHSTKAVGAMLGFVFFACMVYAVVLGARECLEEKLGEEGYESLQDHSSMTISWAVSTAGKWVTYWATATTKTESILHSITIRKLLAASWLTPAMVMLLIGMDFLADNNMFDDYKAEGIIACTGLITGLTWEQSFGSSVWTISRSSDIHPAVVQTVLGLGLVMVLVPGWMRFIVPFARLSTPKRDHAEAGAVADATADAAPDSTAKRPSG